MLAAVSALLLSSAIAAPTGPMGYYRQPSICKDTIVFVAEGDLWRVPVSGGGAARLTTHPGDESWPRISPDCTQVAFVGQYEGPAEVYVMPLTGGTPKRLTYDAARTTVAGWQADKGGARILAATNRFSTLPFMQLTRIDPAKEERELVPLNAASDGCFDDNGALYFTRLSFQGSQTKRYKGGTAQNIWRWAGGDAEATPMTADYTGTSATPMWWKGRVYFITDRSGLMELWSMSPDGKDLKQQTNHAKAGLMGFDVKGPSLSEGRIAYQLGADLWVYDIAKNSDTKLTITLDSDFDQTRENWVKKPTDFLSAAHISADGERVVLTARGQVFVAPKGQGRFVEVTRKDGVRYREARFMPDGKSLLALSDQSGEVEFWSLPPNGVGTPTQLTSDGAVLRFEGVPSPDGKWVVHHDKNQKLWLLDLEKKTSKPIDADPYDYEGFNSIAWAPDSRWFSYENHVGNLNRVIRIYSIESGKITDATTDRFDSTGAAWSPDGKWLYILSDRNLQSVVGSPWGQMGPEPYFEKKTKVYQIALKKGVRSPFAPADELAKEDEKKKDEKKEELRKEEPKKPEPKKEEPKEEPSKQPVKEPEKPRPQEPKKPEPPSEPKKDAAQPESQPDKKDDAKPAEKKGDEKDKKPKPVEIDLDGLATRLVEVPAPPAQYRGLDVNEKRVFLIQRDDKVFNLAFLEVTNKDPEVKTLVKDVTSYDLSGDGKSILVRRKDSFNIIDAGAGAPATLDDKNALKLSGWTFPIVPREEWRQMFTEAWRLERDYFYDTKMVGLDWKAMLDRYLPLVDRVSTRDELSDLIAQMVGELSTLHIFVRGGDLRKGNDDIAPATLGALLVRDQAAGGYRVEKIFKADPDMPERLSPLAAHGVEVGEGDVILQINGRDTLSAPDVAVLLRHQAGKQVLLRVKPKPGTEKPPAPKDADKDPDKRDSEKKDDRKGPITEQPDDGTRLVIAVPISPGSDSDLRYHDWEYTRRLAVEKDAGGDIGYVHLRAMGNENFSEFARGFYPVFNRKGLIIDVRHNRGGNIDSWIISRLMRKAWFYWQPRVGEPTWNMQYAFRGHIAVLCDENTASDGEAFTEGIKRLKLGKVFGMRTWGGEVWLSSSNFLVDGGIATAAEDGVFGPEGQWLIEGHGVDPDVVVDNLPHATFKGQDAQLDAAIKYLKDKIKAEPIEPPKAPAHPNLAPK
jgi:tricorn protease